MESTGNDDDLSSNHVPKLSEPCSSIVQVQVGQTEPVEPSLTAAATGPPMIFPPPQPVAQPVAQPMAAAPPQPEKMLPSPSLTMPPTPVYRPQQQRSVTTAMHTAAPITAATMPPPMNIPIHTAKPIPVTATTTTTTRTSKKSIAKTPASSKSKKTMHWKRRRKLEEQGLLPLQVKPVQVKATGVASTPSLKSGSLKSSSLKSRGRPKKRTSNGLAAPTLPRISLVSEEAPERLVNPLLEAIPLVAAGPGEPVQGAELLAPTHIAYHRPDTYPLSYLGRLLGLDISVPTMEGDPPKFPTPLGDIADIPLQKDVVFLEIPPLGSKQQYLGGKAMNRGDDVDDQRTLDYMDPVYHSFLAQGYSSQQLKAPNATLVYKFAQLQPTQTATIVHQARMLDIVPFLEADNNGDWTFIFAKGSSIIYKRYCWNFKGHIFSSLPSQSFGIVVCYRDKPRALLLYKFQWYQLVDAYSNPLLRSTDKQRELELVMVLEGLAERATVEETKAFRAKKAEKEATATASTATATIGKTVETAAAPVGDGSTETTTMGSILSGEGVEKADSAVLVPDMVPASTYIAGESQDERTGPGNVVESKEEAKEVPAQERSGKAINEPTEVTMSSDGVESAQQPQVDSDGTSAKEDTHDGNTTASCEEGTAGPVEPIPDNVLVVMAALALEHTRACEVWYALVESPVSVAHLMEKCFRMVKLSCRQKMDGVVPMICDLKKCSTRYAFLRLREGDNDSKKETAFSRERLLVRLPNVDEAKAFFEGKNADPVQRPKRASVKSPSMFFTGATGKTRAVAFGIRANLPGNPTGKEIELFRLDENGAAGGRIDMVTQCRMEPQIEILRTFPLVDEWNESDEPSLSSVLAELEKKQKELVDLELGLEPKIRELMVRTVEERMKYDHPDSVEQRANELRVLADNEKIVARRMEMDAAWQKQLEQDMDAVCNICNDGEVTPDNQILFCEACNVAVHQMCYGIEEVPEGDYYCIACRYFQREKMSQVLAQKMKRNASAPRIAPPPLPICCELCPMKQGAYIRTDMVKAKPTNTVGTIAPSKWVHVVCAKWQGLNFVDKSKPEVVEDVTDIKIYFRLLDYTCCLCQGKRGAYQQCRFEGCDKWVHITCARASGLCEVIHGEDVQGPVESNPWSLLCPDHSEINPEELTKEPVPVDRLVRAAKEFPVEPMPPPPPLVHKPFNKLTGKERIRTLADPKYENDFLVEITTKKSAGVRCEVCDMSEERGGDLIRCPPCGAVVCVSCCLPPPDDPDQRIMKCQACRYTEERRKEGTEVETPQCHLCCQQTGPLLHSFANPVNRASYWKNNPKEFKRTLFAKQLWTHALCGMWHKELAIDYDTGKVDCSNVIMSNGRGHVLGKNRCGLCGRRGGLKAKCCTEGCRGHGEARSPYFFHITCARQAGYEVNHSEDPELLFYVRCYKHGGNDYNFRARLEDLIEIEKRRAGKRFKQADAPMSFTHGSRLLNQGILIIRTLSWAWKWAGLWVENGSSWEPLLEEGQTEETMTKKQLRIVDSTPKSRCDDARRCRLASFGAALRNRSYDTEEGFDNESLDCALRAILHTKSLVGPLEIFEIDFYADWLGRAYRSKARVMGLGNGRIPVASDGFNVHVDDKTPKYILGGRRLPGLQALAEGQVFETSIREPDDFLKPEMNEQGVIISVPKAVQPVKKKRFADEPTENLVVEQSEDAPPKKRRGRPPKNAGDVSSTVSLAGSQLSSERKAGVAALAPSAVKKRVCQPPKDRSVSSPPLTQKKGPSTTQVAPTPGAKRRGRPPKSPLMLDEPKSHAGYPAAARPAKRKREEPSHVEESSPGEESSDEDESFSRLRALMGLEGVTAPRKRGRGRPPRPKLLVVNIIVEGGAFDLLSPEEETLAGSTALAMSTLDSETKEKDDRGSEAVKKLSGDVEATQTGGGAEQKRQDPPLSDERKTRREPSNLESTELDTDTSGKEGHSAQTNPESGKGEKGRAALESDVSQNHGNSTEQKTGHSVDESTTGAKKGEDETEAPEREIDSNNEGLEVFGPPSEKLQEIEDSTQNKAILEKDAPPPEDIDASKVSIEDVRQGLGDSKPAAGDDSPAQNAAAQVSIFGGENSQPKKKKYNTKRKVMGLDAMEVELAIQDFSTDTSMGNMRPSRRLSSRTKLGNSEGQDPDQEADRAAKPKALRKPRRATKQEETGAEEVKEEPSEPERRGCRAATKEGTYAEESDEEPSEESSKRTGSAAAKKEDYAEVSVKEPSEETPTRTRRAAPKKEDYAEKSEVQDPSKRIRRAAVKKDHAEEAEVESSEEDSNASEEAAKSPQRTPKKRRSSRRAAQVDHGPSIDYRYTKSKLKKKKKKDEGGTSSEESPLIEWPGSKRRKDAKRHSESNDSPTISRSKSTRTKKPESDSESDPEDSLPLSVLVASTRDSLGPNNEDKNGEDQQVDPPDDSLPLSVLVASTRDSLVPNDEDKSGEDRKAVPENDPKTDDNSERAKADEKDKGTAKSGGMFSFVSSLVAKASSMASSSGPEKSKTDDDRSSVTAAEKVDEENTEDPSEEATETAAAEAKTPAKADGHESPKQRGRSQGKREAARTIFSPGPKKKKGL